jgi:hypothetical protein
MGWQIPDDGDTRNVRRIFVSVCLLEKAHLEAVKEVEIQSSELLRSVRLFEDENDMYSRNVDIKPH